MYYRYYVQVTWTRRTKRPDTGERNLQLLSVGDNTYISDNRFIISNKKVDNVSEDWPRSCCAIISSVDQSSLIDVSLQFQNWELTISRVELSDGGEYLCQASTHPPLAITTHLDVVGRREEKGGRERERGSQNFNAFTSFSNYTRQIVLQCNSKSASKIHKEKMRSQIISLLLLLLFSPW